MIDFIVCALLISELQKAGWHYNSYHEGFYMIALKLDNISKYYASQTAVVMGLSNVSLSFSTGEFVAITGENGSGKSTLANVIGGMIPYESGELYVMGQPTSHYNAADWERYRRDLIGFISQDYGILPGNTVFENVESALILSGCEKDLAKEKTAEILQKVELEDFAGRRAARLSSGQKQRLAIARALAKPSKILIADEPTGNLDRENSDKVIKLLHEASDDRLVIIITHEFSEVQDYINRHVVLSDGKVVQDTVVREKSAEASSGAAGTSRETLRKERAPEKGLSAYIAKLTARARPVFFFLTALILLFTCISSFIFIGNFIVATDDVPTRIYDDSAFINGDPTRLVLSKDGWRAFTDDEIENIGSQKYVRRLEKYGYISDVNYYYREDVDYRQFSSADFGPDYDPVENSDAYEYTVKTELLDNEPQYMRSVLQAGDVRQGRMAEGFYEVLSSDPDVKAGTRIRVFIKDSMHWGISQFIGLTFDVVGETSGDRGLYFSESFCKMFNSSVLARIYTRTGRYLAGGDLGKYPVAPFDRERFSDYMIPVYPEKELPGIPGQHGIDDGKETETEPVIPDELAENEFIIPPDPSGKGIEYGQSFTMSVGSWYMDSDDVYKEENTGSADYTLVCAGQHRNDHPRFILLNPETFEKMTEKMPSNQISVFISDYAYTQRAIEEFVSMGYVTLSPFTQGATTKDETLEAERISLLWISLAASVMTLVLQLILLNVTFSSLRDHYRLLSNMGLRANTAYSSLAILFLVLTLSAEAVGAAVILLLNRYGYVRVVNIFKYLEAPKLILIFAIHFIFCVIAYFSAARTIRKQVFSINGFYEDIDGELMEEVMGE